MCGFLALLDDRFGEDFDAALDTLAPRGPDDRGTWREGPVRLGHRRLSIVDLAGGHQPMVSVDGRHVVVFNGEIYGFGDLRRDLEAAGCSFATDHSDTEVLLEGYRAWGLEGLLRRLDGIFAFVLWDREARRLVAARDRFGVKPLFYARTPAGLVAASTMEPFFRLRGFPRTLDPRGLREYLAAQAVSWPYTLLRDVACLPPASALSYDLDTQALSTWRYWDVPAATDTPLSFEALVEATDAALAASVRLQRVADVPVGVFLSGGIDSSLLVHHMAQGGGDVKTFTVRFPDVPDYDEGRIARLVAERYGTEHHELDAEALTGDVFAEAFADLDQPLADTSYLPLRSLSALCKEHVKVMLAGDGGDEIFGGYPRYLETEATFPDSAWKARLRRWTRAGLLPKALLRRFLAGKERLLWNRVKFGPFPGTRKDLVRLLAPPFREACEVDETLATWRSLCARFSDPIDTDALLRADPWTYLADDLLVKTDRASMAHGLEVRVPILGRPVVDAALPQPASVKLERGLKAVLVALARRHLPREVWDRKKHGFSVPARSYLAGPWKERGDALVARTADLAPFLDAREVARIWERARAGRGGRDVVTVLALLAWLSTHPIDA